MKTYFAYEIATDGAFELGAYLEEAARDRAVEDVLRRLRLDKEDVDCSSFGTVHATSVEEALDKIRAGCWSAVTQYV